VLEPGPWTSSAPRNRSRSVPYGTATPAGTAVDVARM